MAENGSEVTEKKKSGWGRLSTLARSQEIDSKIHADNKALHAQVAHLLAEIPVSQHPKVEISLPDHGSSTSKPMRISMPNLMSLVNKSHSAEAEQLQNVVNGLTEKVQNSVAPGEEIKQLRKEVEQSLKERADLQAQIDEKTKQMRAEGEESNAKMNELKATRDENKADEANRKANHNELKSQLGMERARGQEIKRDVTISKGKRGNTENINQHTKATEEHFERSEKNKDELKNNLEATQKQFANENAAQQTQIDALRKEIEDLRADMAAVGSAQEAYTADLNKQKEDLKEAFDKNTDDIKTQADNKKNKQSEAFNDETAEIKEKLTNEIQQFTDATNAEKDELRKAHDAKLAEQAEKEKKFLEEYEAQTNKIKTELEAEIAAVEADSASTQADHDAATEKLSQDLKAQLEDLTKAKQNTIDEFRQAKDAEIAELKEKNAKLTEELKQLKDSIKIDRDQLEVIQAADEKCKQSEARRKEKQAALEKDTNDYDAQSKIFKSTMDGSLETNKNLADKLQDNRLQLETVMSYLHRQTAKQHDRTNQAVTLEQRCCMKEDLHQVLESKNIQNEHHQTVNGQLEKELSSAHDFIVSQTEKSLEDHQEFNEAQQTLIEKNREAEYIKALIIELKKRRPVYVPVKEDIVDVAVGEFVNTREDPLVVPFLREDHEIYTFGTKRVYVKLEKGKVIIRVGGGFMQLAEFIEIYTPVELEKQENRLSGGSPEQKKMMTKMVEHHLAGQEPMSPQKAAKIIHDTVENKYATAYGVRKLSPERRRGQSPGKSP